MSDAKLTTVLKAALEYRAQGRSVFPIVNKQPKVKWKGLQSRLATEEELKAWFGQNPSLQIAMVMGRVSGGLWVMDADGHAAVDWMQHNAPATTVHVRTKRGRHAYYLTPPGVEIRCAANAIPDLKKSTGHQIDIKGEGGYTVVPPSPYRGGEYRWEIDGQGWAGLTVWQPPNVRASSPRDGNGNLNIDLSDVRSAMDYRLVSEGERNDTLARGAGGMIARGLTVEEVMIWALGWNMIYCVPPLGEEEVRKTVESIANAHIRNHGSLPARPVLVEDFPEPKIIAQPDDDVPAAILHPGGILEHIMDYTKQCFASSISLFSLCAGIALIGTLVGQKVMTETGLRTNFYFFCLANTGAGKGAQVKTIETLLFEANCSEHLGEGRLASDTALLRMMENRPKEKPAILLAPDEIGDVTGAAKNKNNTALHGIFSVLKELYSSPDRIIKKAYADSKNNIEIQYPHLSFYATGVPSRFWKSMTSDDICDGFLPRALIFDFKKKKEQVKHSQIKEVPAYLAENLKKLGQIDVLYKGNTMRTVLPREIPKNAEASALFDEWEKTIISAQNSFMDTDPGLEGVYNRIPEHAHKLALVHAVSLAEGLPPFVPLESVKYAIDFIDWYLPKITGHIGGNIHDSFLNEMQNKVLQLIDQKGSMSNGAIFNHLRRQCTKTQIEDVLSTLESAEKIEKVTTTRDLSKGGRPTAFWRRPESREGE